MTQPRNSILTRTLALAAGTVLLPSAALAQTGVTHTDAPDDVVLRGEDFGGDDAIRADTVPTEIISIRLAGWRPTTPGGDRFVGFEESAATADILRVDLVFDGLVNPAGPVDSGISGPFEFGPSPAIFIVELDLDGEVNTGGSLDRFIISWLANAGRLGGLPNGARGLRAARSGIGEDIDLDFQTAPQIERSGFEAWFVMCGCSLPQLVLEVGDGDGRFDAGEEMIVRGRFFQRIDGLDDASAMIGGSELQRYDPIVDVLFVHDQQEDRTTASLVFPLTMAGDAYLRNEPEQAPDNLFDVSGSHTSVEEMLADVIAGANGDNGPVSEPTLTLISGWAGREPTLYLDPTTWGVAAIAATAYQTPPDDGALYVWTDAAFGGAQFADVNSDGAVDTGDQDEISAQIAARDGTALDLDGQVNGSVLLPAWALRFVVYDLDYDGDIDPDDLTHVEEDCIADWDANGIVNSADIGAFLSDYFTDLSNETLITDVDGNGVVNAADVGQMLSFFFAANGECD